MERPRVYVETTIPSYYHGTRSTPSIAAKQRWTRAWWAVAEEQFLLLTGAPVIEELESGPAENASAWISLIRPLPVLPVSPAVLSIVDFYETNKLMPRDGYDALHLAVSSYSQCDYIVTWNCRHLANPNKFAHIRTVNAQLGLQAPLIVTPLQMLESFPCTRETAPTRYSMRSIVSAGDLPRATATIPGGW
jgi:hypothetical protein